MSCEQGRNLRTCIFFGMCLLGQKFQMVCLHDTDFFLMNRRCRFRRWRPSVILERNFIIALETINFLKNNTYQGQDYHDLKLLH